MCGINGILRLDPGAPPVDPGELLLTRDAMTSRGPDGAGLWLSEDGRIGLGHRRLAILDLSDAAAQPMATPDGRFHIVLNGEIYNFPELRRELEADGHRFCSTGDTEVVLALYARDGRAALAHLRGMYALALWDDTAKILLLARDPLGIKPLYYAVDEETRMLRFASSVKALEAGGRVSREVDPAGLAGFFLWGSVPEPHTIRRAIRAVPAGTSIRVQSGVQSRWAPESPVPTELRVESSGAADWPEAIEESVRCHLVSDVPVAVFLSAGLDSATVAALATRHLDEPPATFTMRFEPTLGSALDEGPVAAEIARRLGTRHVERTVGRAEFRDLWESALSAMDQPSIDGFNTYLVSRAAAEAGLKVVLSGLGGDELLGSYPSFRQVPRMARLGRLARTAGRLPGAASAWATLARRLRPGQPKLTGVLRWASSLAGAYFLRRGLFLPEELPELLGMDRVEEALSLHDPIAYGRETLNEGEGTEARRQPWDAVQTLETGIYLRNQLLRDADWASMAHSLELRVPFVDAWLRRRLSPAARAEARGRSKAEILRRVIQKSAPELPPTLWTRPKTGFYIPVMDWLQAERRRDSADDRAHPARRMMGSDSRRLALGIAEAWGWSGGAP